MEDVPSIGTESYLWLIKPSLKGRMDHTNLVEYHLSRWKDTLDPGSSAVSIKCELRKKIRRKYRGEETSDWETWKNQPETEFTHQQREYAQIEVGKQTENFSLNCFNGSFR